MQVNGNNNFGINGFYGPQNNSFVPVNRNSNGTLLSGTSSGDGFTRTTIEANDTAAQDPAEGNKKTQGKLGTLFKLAKKLYRGAKDMLKKMMPSTETQKR